MSVTMIAEWGQPPDLPTAMRQAEATAGFGGRVAKWQMFDPARLASRHAGRYWDARLGGRRSQLATFTDNGTLTTSEWGMLASYCREIGVEFMVTPFDLPAVDTLAGLGVRSVKIASADITYRPLVEAVGAMGADVVMSCGAATDEEVERALAWLGDGRRDVTIMACDLVYPCPDEQADPGRVADLRYCHKRVGYSDHTLGTTTGAVAVALGATVLEKHCTLDTTGVAPDNRMALTPDQAAEYVRYADQAFTLTTPVIGDPQQPARLQARRAWHAVRDLPAGHTLADTDVIGLRPCPPSALPVDQCAAGLVLDRPVQAGDPVPA